LEGKCSAAMEIKDANLKSKEPMGDIDKDERMNGF
jgi:hypothetical protein